MKYFVTGGGGFLGSALLRALASDGNQIDAPRSRDCDLTNAGSLERFSSNRYDRIIHLAAWTQAGDFCLRHPGEQWIINQQINTNLLAWWARCQPHAKLVFMGTSCAYSPELPLVEANYMRGEPIESLHTYAMTKRMLGEGAVAIARQFGLEYLCAVPSTLYGPGYHTDGRQMHFIFDLIRKILIATRGGPAPVLWGDGHQRRELVFVDDFVSILLRLMESTSNEIVNIGAGEEHSIRDFAGQICRLVGYPPDAIQYDSARYVGARSKCLDICRLRQLLPDLRLTPLSAGLAETVGWFLTLDESKVTA